MKLKVSHIVVLLLAALAAFMAFALWRSQRLTAASGAGEAAFLEEVHQRAAAAGDEGAVGSVLPTAGNTLHAANIEVEHPDVDLGTVPNDALSEHPYTIRNTGDLPLRIMDVKTSCACTQAKFEKGMEIAPGAEGIIQIVIDPARIPGFSATRYLTIASNDPDTPGLVINVTSHVQPEFEVDPPEIDLGVVDKGQPYTAKVVVRQLQEAPLEIESVGEQPGKEPVPFQDDVQYTLMKLPEAQWRTPGKAEYEITAEVGANAPSGTVAYDMVLKTNVKRLAWYKVRVRGVFEAPYTVTPRWPEVMGLVGDGSEPAAIEVRGKQGIAVQNLRFDAAKVSAAVRNGANSETVYVDVRVAPGAPGGTLTDFVQFDVMQDGVAYAERVKVQAAVPKQGEAVAPSTAPEAVSEEVPQ